MPKQLVGHWLFHQLAPFGLDAFDDSLTASITINNYCVEPGLDAGESLVHEQVPWRRPGLQQVIAHVALVHRGPLTSNAPRRHQPHITRLRRGALLAGWTG
jgi:hypothetical protein